MIELDANGNLPAVTQARVYVVAGFEDGEPFSGLNHWSNGGSMTQERIEAYTTFQGWACETLLTDVIVDNQDPPSSAAHFRVALFEDPRLPGRRYTALDVGPASASEHLDLAQQPGFIGWISPTFLANLVAPVPRVLVRHRVAVNGTVVESLFTATREQVSAAFGRTVRLGSFPGTPENFPVMLAPGQFCQLSSDQRVVQEMLRFANPDGTICGINPLAAVTVPLNDPA